MFVSTKQLVVFSLVALIIGVIVFSPVQSPVLAASSDTVSGRAWSENIGWINFNCTDFNSCDNVNYGVTVAPNGNVSGRAWSEHIGWISFDQTSGCPTAPCQAKRNPGNGELTGWARACAGTLKGDCTGPDADGWDGWIHFKGSIYGVTARGCEWYGRAWGSTMIGWINFRGTVYGVRERTEGCIPFIPPPAQPLPTPPSESRCTTNNDCRSNVCQNGVCVLGLGGSCTTNIQCQNGLTCLNGLCAAPPPTNATSSQEKTPPPFRFRETPPGN